MQIIVKGKNMDVSDQLRQFVEGKISKLERVLPTIAEVEVELSSARTKSADSRYAVQVTLKANGVLIRGEQAASDSYSAMHAVLDKLDRQIERYKTRRLGAYNKGTPDVRVAPLLEDEPMPADEDGEEGHLVRVKRFAMKPMDVEEALMQMQLLGHSFFVFFNSETDGMSVVYRREDGNFGLIEPELV